MLGRDDFSATEWAGGIRRAARLRIQRANTSNLRRDHAPKSLVRVCKIKLRYLLTAYPSYGSMLEGGRVWRARGEVTGECMEVDR